MGTIRNVDHRDDREDSNLCPPDKGPKLERNTGSVTLRWTG